MKFVFAFFAICSIQIVHHVDSRPDAEAMADANPNPNPNANALINKPLDEYSIESHEAHRVRFLFERLKRRRRQRREHRLNEQMKKFNRPNMRKKPNKQPKKKKCPKKHLQKRKKFPKRKKCCATIDPSDQQQQGDDDFIASTAESYSGVNIVDGRISIVTASSAGVIPIKLIPTGATGLQPIASTSRSIIVVNNYINTTIINEPGDDNGGDDDDDEGSGSGSISLEVTSNGNGTAKANGTLTVNSKSRTENT